MNGLYRVICGILLAGALLGCTIGVVLGDATTDGRPVVFKNRDITGWDLEFKVIIPSSGYAYAVNSYVGSSTAWMGVNEVGFGIVQSAAYNVSGWGSGLSNGSMMNYALQRCDSVGDFQRIIDSTDATGRSTKACYGVCDAYGGGAIFECSVDEHARYEPDSLGIVVRANFAYIGGSGRVGENRMERAYQLMADAAVGDSLNTEFVIKHVVTDLLYPGQDPYPLPWTGSFSGMPVGWVDTGPFTEVQTVCNANTHASGVVMGVGEGGNPADALIWGFLGVPVVAMPVPVFPAALDEPDSVAGSGNPMCELGEARTDSAFHDGSNPPWLDTGFLLNSAGEGALTYIIPAIEWAIDTVCTQLAHWDSAPPSPADRAEFQDTVTNRLLNFYRSGEIVNVVENRTPENTGISIYPNPFNSSLRIELSEPGGSVEIYDIRGRMVDRIGITGDRDYIDWQPKSDLPGGIYLISSGTRKLNTRAIYLK